MMNKKFLLGILVMVLVLGMTIVGCDDDSSGEDGNTDPKTLVIQNIPINTYNEISYSSHNIGISLFITGTTTQQMQSLIGFVAGAYMSNNDINVINTTGSVTVTIPLRKLDNNRWTGNGTYDIILTSDISNGINGTMYKASSINFSSEITSVLYSSFQIIP